MHRSPVPSTCHLKRRGQAWSVPSESIIQRPVAPEQTREYELATELWEGCEELLKAGVIAVSRPPNLLEIDVNEVFCQRPTLGANSDQKAGRPLNPAETRARQTSSWPKMPILVASRLIRFSKPVVGTHGLQHPTDLKELFIHRRSLGSRGIVLVCPHRI